MNRAGLQRTTAVVVFTVVVGACGSVPTITPLPAPAPAATEEDRRDREEERRQREEAERVAAIAEMKERARAAVPAAPDLAQPSSSAATRVWRSAINAKGLRVMVGTDARALWLMRDTVVLFRAPVAVGTERPFTYGGRKYDFTTPIGRRQVLGKDTMPLWVPPDWHYFEVAVERDLEVVYVRKGQRYMLTDSTYLEMRGNDVGRVNRFGNFWPFTPGAEIVFDGKVFIPPIGSRQRQVPEVLGTHKLVMGDGYLIHGTDREDSIGDAVSHGCVRMFNEDVARLYEIVPVGTPVFIF